MIAAASHSPALDALVRGHLAAGRPGMAALALRLAPEAVAALDKAFAEAKDDAAALGIIAAIPSPRLNPEGNGWICDTCGREWAAGETSGCQPCIDAIGARATSLGGL